jgi:hypothetical protein
MNDEQRALYATMVASQRASSTRPEYFEMCAAGWLPETTDRRAEIIENPHFGLHINLSGGLMYEVHFGALGEPVPVVSHRIHPLDTDGQRWHCRAKGHLAPIPFDVVIAAFAVEDPNNAKGGGGEPSDEVIAATVMLHFPNWAEQGSDYFRRLRVA